MSEANRAVAYLNCTFLQILAYCASMLAKNDGNQVRTPSSQQNKIDSKVTTKRQKRSNHFSIDPAFFSKTYHRIVQKPE